MAKQHDSSVKDAEVHGELDWTTAEVNDGELEVSVTGDHSKPWRKRLVAVLERLDLGGNPWGRVHATKTGLKVSDVEEGREPELRHFLEAAVQQTNADFAGEPDDPPAEAGGEASDADARMTEAFRAAADSQVAPAAADAPTEAGPGQV